MANALSLRERLQRVFPNDPRRVQAWLELYHMRSCVQPNVLRIGEFVTDLQARKKGMN